MSQDDYEKGRKDGEESGRLAAVENIQKNHHTRISKLEKTKVEMWSALASTYLYMLFQDNIK